MMGDDFRPSGKRPNGSSFLQRIKDLLSGPEADQVREEYEPAGECPNCRSDDYWKKSSYTGTMYRCLNCRREGLGK